ncbi:MAG: RNA-binding S4 domain-containing protein [Proteobacteria bacterium]|nr:RNA-binding S4 domain-containing protein [Pseudomonadota bacterium]
MSETRIRIDKWLWHARFHKTRSLAQAAAVKGHIRLNGRRIEKASAEVRIGDMLTVPRGKEVVVVRVLGCGIRRGPAAEAQALYEILTDEMLDPKASAP